MKDRSAAGPQDPGSPSPPANTGTTQGSSDPELLRQLLASSGPGVKTVSEDILLGQVAVEWKLVDLELLKDCLRSQAESRSRGERVLLGDLLVSRGAVKPEDIVRLMKEQGRRLEGRPDIPRYEIEGKLGEGATAVVYRAWDRELRRAVALKVLKMKSAMSEIARHRFQREATAAASLAHPNVVTIFDAGEHQGQPYLVLELVEGRPLPELIAKAGGEKEHLLRILEKASRGVAAAHAKGIIHRDLKPDNILVTPEGEPKVGDFGLAHLTGASTELTKTGTALGTPLYMSPEQVRGDPSQISPSTDVYALGAILYEMGTGRCPHRGETLMEIYGKIVREDPLPPRRVNPRLSRDLETIAMKALEKSASQRYSSAEEFARDLERYLAGEPIEARPPGRLPRLLRSLVRHPARLTLAGALLLAATVFLAVRAGTGSPSPVPRSSPSGPATSGAGDAADRGKGSIQAAASSPGSPGPVTTWQGLVAYWSFDEEGGPAPDRSNHGHAGEFLGGAQRGLGIRGGGLSLSGAGACVRVPRTADFEPKAFSVALWVLPQGRQVTHANLIRKTWRNNSGPPYLSWGLQLNDKGRQPESVSFATAHEDKLFSLQSTASVAPDGLWIHIAATFDPEGPAPQKKLYINGELTAEATETRPVTHDYTPQSDVYIGSNGKGDEGFIGQIDEACFFARALSPAEVKVLSTR